MDTLPSDLIKEKAKKIAQEQGFFSWNECTSSQKSLFLIFAIMGYLDEEVLDKRQLQALKQDMVETVNCV